ncbi:MAG: alpha/beta fold hydrolase [Pirellulales bacterium]|nr:alpha/beta fold hydrolase [Pirellulales bacterium]
MSSKHCGIITKDVVSGRIVGRLHLPDREGRYPGVVVLGGSGGGLNWSADVAAQLAQNGYAALALAYFGMPSLPKTLVNIEIEYFEAAFDWLKRQSSVNSTHLALVGGSRGGELALQLAASFPSIAVVVCYAPSSVRWGPVGGLATIGKPAWKWQGQPLPQMPRPRLIRLASELGKLILSRVFRVPYRETPLFETALMDERAVQEATIPVERIRGPVLLISGTDDQLWPSTMMCEMITDRLKANSHPFIYKHLKYEGAGHAISLPDLQPDCYPIKVRHRITGITYALGGTPEANAIASKDAWKEVLKFLAEHTSG